MFRIKGLAYSEDASQNDSGTIEVRAKQVVSPPDEDDAVHVTGSLSLSRAAVYNVANGEIISMPRPAMPSGVRVELSDGILELLEDCVVEGFRARNSQLGKMFMDDSSKAEFGLRKWKRRDFSRPRYYELTVRHPDFSGSKEDKVSYVLEEAIMLGPNSNSIVLDEPRIRIFDFSLRFVSPLIWFEHRQRSGYVQKLMPLTNLVKAYFSDNVGNYDLTSLIGTKLRNCSFSSILS